MIFLHSNMDNAQNNLRHWAYLSAKGWIVAIPQSSQALWTGAYNWVDDHTTLEEMDKLYQRLVSQYSLDGEQLIWGGFSMGAEMALTLVLNGDFPARGFILLGPGGPKMDDYQPVGGADRQSRRQGPARRDLDGRGRPHHPGRQCPGAGRSAQCWRDPHPTGDLPGSGPRLSRMILKP